MNMFTFGFTFKFTFTFGFTFTDRASPKSVIISVFPVILVSFLRKLRDKSTMRRLKNRQPHQNVIPVVENHALVRHFTSAGAGEQSEQFLAKFVWSVLLSVWINMSAFRWKRKHRYLICSVSNALVPLRSSAIS